MGNWDDSLGSPIAILTAIKTNRSLFLLHKYIRSFPLGLQRNIQNHTEQNRTEISNLQEKVLMDGASWERGTSHKGHQPGGEAR